MLKLIYDALWYPALPFAALAVAGLDAQKLRQRVGAVEVNGDRGQNCAWLHAASVGEIEGVRPIICGLAERNRGLSFFVTCMTDTGCRAARGAIAQARAVTLAPLDCPSCVRRFLNAVRPHALLIAETELWPNYLLEARRAGVPVAIINGRISARSLARYRALGSIFRPALESVVLLLAQTDEDAQRYAALGAPKSAIIVVGNPKFDLDQARDVPTLRAELESFTAGRSVFVAGSTGPGEESVVIEAYRVLRRDFPELALVVAPRHLNRAEEVGALLRAASLAYVRASQLPSCATLSDGDALNRRRDNVCVAQAQSVGEPTALDARAAGSVEKGRAINDRASIKPDAALQSPAAQADLRPPALLLDTLGELRALYFRATLAFVGGSLRPGRGGQNLAEPAAAALAVMFGPYHENQKVAARALVESGGGCVVRDAGEIVQAAAPLLQDAALRRAKGESARAAIQRLGGAAERSLMALARLSNLG